MRTFVAVAVGLSALLCSVHADIAVSGATAVELTKKSNDVSKGNVDASWFRAEPKLSGSLKDLGLTGLIHLRFQYDLGTTSKDTAKATVGRVQSQARQVYFKLPVSILEILAGRWYEIYSPGYNYFGRYLVESKPTSGTGAMNTNYTVVDGLKLTLNIAPIHCALQAALLPKDSRLENDYLMVMFGGSPTEQVKFNIGGNFEALRPENAKGDPVNRFIANCGITFVKELKLGVFGEMAIVDFNEASDNIWLLAGLTSKATPVLDKIQFELEIKNHRLGDPGTDKNLAWMLLLQKKAGGLTLDLNIGADPTVLGSKDAGDLGVIFRTTASF